MQQNLLCAVYVTLCIPCVINTPLPHTAILFTHVWQKDTFITWNIVRGIYQKVDEIFHLVLCIHKECSFTIKCGIFVAHYIGAYFQSEDSNRFYCFPKSAVIPTKR